MLRNKTYLLLSLSLPLVSYILVKILFLASNFFFHETFARMEYVFLDRYFISRYQANPPKIDKDLILSNRSLVNASEQVSLVVIDKKSMEELKDAPDLQEAKKQGQNLVQWPFDRRVMARAIKKLEQAGAHVIGIDLLYLHEKNQIEDKALVDAVKNAGNVVLASMVEHDFDGRMLEYKEPFKELSSAALKTGFVNVDTDTDGILRTVPLHLLSPKGEKVHSFAIQCWHATPLHLNYDLQNSVQGDLKLSIPDKRSREIPPKDIYLYTQSEAQSRLLINWKGPSNSFVTLSFSDLFHPGRLEDLKPLLKGKIVLIGLHHPGLQDSYPTPLYGITRTQTPGVEIHANAINTLSNEHYRSVKKLPQHIQFPIFYAIALALVMTTMRLRVVFSFPVFLTGLGLGWIIANFVLFRNFYLLMEVTTPGIAYVLCYLCSITYRVLQREKEKSQIRKVFNQYVSNQVVDELLMNPDNLNMGGKSLEITTLFSDIRGFTTMSENITPEEVVDILNTYFELMVAIITKYNGTINKFIGDAIMVLFGAPIRDNVSPRDQAIHCVRCAIEMQETMKASNDQRLRKLQVGIGITTGYSVVGNIGAQKHKDYTAIGDKINLAARLESRSGAFEVIVDQQTYEYCKDLESFSFEELEPFQVKGKQEIIKAYRVLY